MEYSDAVAITAMMAFVYIVCGVVGWIMFYRVLWIAIPSTIAGTLLAAILLIAVWSNATHVTTVQVDDLGTITKADLRMGSHNTCDRTVIQTDQGMFQVCGPLSVRYGDGQHLWKIVRDPDSYSCFSLNKKTCANQ